MWWNYNWDEYIDFDFDTGTSKPAVNTQNVDWRHESRERSIAEVIHSGDVASLVNESGDEADESKITYTVSEALKSLDRVKNCTEVHWFNCIDLIGRVEKLKLKNFKAY